MVTAYRTATKGLPLTERTPSPFSDDFKVAS
jgi:hypothetical protein